MDLTRDIEKFELVFLDLETTGLDVVTGDAICEIGAYKIKKREVIDKFQTLVNPGRKVSREAYSVHKISDRELEAAPKFQDLQEALTAFIGKSVICAYNAAFDMGFIQDHLRKCGRAVLNLPAIDILGLARAGLSLTRFNLSSTAKFFKIKPVPNRHRALADAYLAYQVFINLVDIFKAKGVSSLGDFLSLCGYDNDFFRVRENQKIDWLNKAIEQAAPVNLRYFSGGRVCRAERVLPLRVYKERRYYYLLYQARDEAASRMKLRNIFSLCAE
jgi:DNA polymerase-3 subunit alpha (Gram-positive type)